MNTDSILHITLEKDESLHKVKNKILKQPNYFKTGDGTMNKHHIKSVDLLKEMDNMTSNSRKFLLMIKDGMIFNTELNSRTFIVKVIGETNYQKKIIKEGYKELNSKDLVRRVKRGYYMLNPNAITTNYEAQINEWNKLKKLS